MDSGKPSSNPEAPTWGSFALVTYLPEPLGSYLNELRQVLPGGSHPDAHITFLPPRALSVPLESAALQVQQILQSVQTFELSLGAVKIFNGTNIVYLEVDLGYQDLENLHASLNDGSLFAQEEFEYIPHLTLGGPLASGAEDKRFEKVAKAWENARFSPRFVVKELVLLWQEGSYWEPAWTRVSAHRLQPAPANSLATRT